MLTSMTDQWTIGCSSTVVSGLILCGENRRVRARTGRILPPAVEIEDDDTQNGDDGQAVSRSVNIPRISTNTYTRPMANMTLTPSFFLPDRLSFEIS